MGQTDTDFPSNDFSIDRAAWRLGAAHERERKARANVVNICDSRSCRSIARLVTPW